MPLNYKALLEQYESLGVEPAGEMLRESLGAGDLKTDGFDFGRLFCECFGYGEWRRAKDRRVLAREVMESAGAVMTSTFSNISQQMMYGEVMKSADLPELVFSKIIPDRHSERTKGGRVPGVTPVGDEAQEVAEKDPYPFAGPSEDWTDRPSTRKRGVIVAVTREAIFDDDTGQVMAECAGHGKWMFVNKEKRAIDAVLDRGRYARSAIEGGHRYHWRNTSYATYGNSSTAHPWDNLEENNPLIDWTSVNKVEMLLGTMTDPNTGEPLLMPATDLIVAQDLKHTARQIFDATETRVQVGGYATTGNLSSRTGPNSLDRVNVLTSKLLRARMLAYGIPTTTWWYGNVAEALVYWENWPTEVTQAPSGNHDEFHRDIIAQWKVSERGSYGYEQPRYMVESRA